MNFKTRLSYNNRISFIYKNGEVKHTPFTEVTFFGDDYILAKSATATFYSLLDTDGNAIATDLKVVHRFQNGSLLTYKPFVKQYRSSDGPEYGINYNVYSLYNFALKKSVALAIIQSDEIKDEITTEAYKDKCSKTLICNFLNKPVYSFKELLFSEMLDNEYIITGNSLLANKINIAPAPDGFIDFTVYKERRIWNLVNIFEQTEHKGETDLSQTTTSGISFREAEITLTGKLSTPEMPDKEEFADKTIYNELTNESIMYRTWKKRNKIHAMIKNILSISIN